jgi:hypothetical protein
MAEGERPEEEHLWALVPGNDPDAGRINLVFAGWNWDDFDRFVRFARHTLSWDGHPYLIAAGFPAESLEEAEGSALGLFAVEPWRSHTDWFNVWYTDLEPDNPQAWFLPDSHPFSLDDVVVVTLAIEPESYDPNLTFSFAAPALFTGPGAPVRPASGNPFGHVVMRLTRTTPMFGITSLIHEMGHAMFNLADEYVGEVLGFDGRYDLSSWPSCAEGPAEAEAWWGDLAGEVDSMVDVWVDEMTTHGVWDEASAAVVAESWRSKVEVGFVDGGCYATPGSIRATEDSLMNSGIPVMGAVNRRWAETVLDLWAPVPGP